MRSSCLVFMVLLGACETPPPEPTGQVSGALIDQVEPGMVFISPSAPGPRDFGDFVVTADPTVRITKTGAQPGTPPVAVFTRLGTVGSGDDTPDEQARRIRAVLQDKVGDPQDLDDDFNPVGFFQIRWATTADLAGHTYRIQVTLPDGRVVGETDVFVGATRADLRALDTTQVIGVLAGNSVNIRFRVDAGAVDVDGDGVLDWGDNCAKTPNPSQADRDQDGEGDACDTCPPTTCPVGQVVDEVTCGCECEACPPGLRADPTTCTCACDLPAGNPCSGNFVLDPGTCRCTCPDTLCPPGTVLDPATCGCRCDGDSCTGSQVQDPNTCGCACPQLLRGEVAPCPGLEVLDPTTCTCGCPETLCAPGQRANPETCGCECASSCAPAQVQNPVDCTCSCPQTLSCGGGQLFDPTKCECRCFETLLPGCSQGQVPFPPGSLCPVCIAQPDTTHRDVIVSRALAAFDDQTGCSGVATFTAPEVLGWMGLLSLPLTFGPVPGCELGQCNRTFAARIGLDLAGVSAIGFNTTAFVGGDLGNLAKVECWLAFRAGEGLNGEIEYLARLEDTNEGQGGGFYGAPPPDEDEVFVVCDGGNEPALASCPQVARYLSLFLQ